MKKDLTKFLIAVCLMFTASLFSQSTTSSYTQTLRFFNSDNLQIYQGARIAAPTMTLPNSLTTYTSSLAFGNSDLRQIYNAVRGIGDAVTSSTVNAWSINGNSVTAGLLGTTSNNDFAVITNNLRRVLFRSNGVVTVSGDSINFNSTFVVDGGRTVNGANPDILLKSYYNGRLMFENTNSPFTWYLQNGTTSGASLNSFFIGSSNNTGLSAVRINSASVVNIANNLRVGSLTSLPDAVLHLSAGSATQPAVALTSQAAVTSPTNGNIWYDGSLQGFNFYHNSNGSSKFAAFTNSVFTTNLFIVASTSGLYNMQVTTSNTTGIGFSPNGSLAFGVSTNSVYTNKAMRIGSAVAPTKTLDVTGSVGISGTLTSTGIQNTGTITSTGAATVAGALSTSSIVSTSKTAGIGYAVGSGSTVTQGTNRTTGVTINDVVGSITLFNTAGSATWQSFTMTNSTIAANDIIVVNQRSGTDLYMISVTAVSAGSCRISFATTGGTTSEAPVFNYAVIKGATN